jgi:tetratricopeptide (TPR) repeat protein
MNYKELAKKGYQEAQKLYEELSKKDFNGVAPSLAWTKNRLLQLKSQIDKEALVDIEKLYLSKIRNLRRLVKRNPKKYKSTLAWTLNLLANFYEEQYQGLPKSLKTRTEAYRIYKKIFTKEDRKIGIDYFQTMNSLAYSYLVQKERKSAKNFYEKAFELIKEMSEKEPKYLPYYALSLNQLALLHQDEHQFKRAKEYYLRSLEVYKKLLPKKPEKYTLLSLNVQKNMAQFHLLQGEFLEAEKKYFFILKEYNKMKKAHPSKYQLKIAELYNTIARIYLLNPKKRQYAKAESYLLKALKTDKNKKDKFQKKRNNVVATTQFYLALLYDTQRKFEKADSYYLKSFEAKRSLKREEIYAQSLGKREEFIKTRAFYEEMLKRYPRKEQQAEIWRNYGMFYRAVSNEGAKRRLMNSLKLYQSLAKQYQIAYNEIKEIERLIHQMDATLATKTPKAKPSQPHLETPPHAS